MQTYILLLENQLPIIVPAAKMSKNKIPQLIIFFYEPVSFFCMTAVIERKRAFLNICPS